MKVFTKNLKSSLKKRVRELATQGKPVREATDIVVTVWRMSAIRKS